ncbi:MAG: hypothetical protein ABUK01_11200 [Leptospirales bacterium]
MDIEEITKEYHEIKKLPSAKITAQQRGITFEKLINQLFDIHNISIKSGYHTSDNKSEQIDGVIEVYHRIILLEIKWVEVNLAASHLYSFIGKVDNKLDGTLGLFISYEELSNNFIESISKGRHRNILIIHGSSNIDLLFTKDFPIVLYLEYIIKLSSYDNINEFSATQFNNLVKEDKVISKNITRLDKSTKSDFLKYILVKKEIEDYLIEEKVADLSEEIMVGVIEYLLENFSMYYRSYIANVSKKKNYLFLNFASAISLILKNGKIIKSVTPKYVKLFEKTHDLNLLNPIIFTRLEKPIYEYESSRKKKIFSETLLETLKENRGDFNTENTLTYILENVWSKIPENIRKEIFGIYMDFLFSSRNYGFGQKDYAKTLISTNVEPLKESFIESWLEQQVALEVEEFPISTDDLDRGAKYFTRRFKDVAYGLNKSDEELYIYIRNLFERHMP